MRIAATALILWGSQFTSMGAAVRTQRLKRQHGLLLSHGSGRTEAANCRREQLRAGHLPKRGMGYCEDWLSLFSLIGFVSESPATRIGHPRRRQEWEAQRAFRCGSAKSSLPGMGGQDLSHLSVEACRRESAWREGTLHPRAPGILSTAAIGLIPRSSPAG